jgi:hypothetical protein
MKTQTETKVAIHARKFFEDGGIDKKTVRVSEAKVQEASIQLSEAGYEILRTQTVTVSAISYLFREVAATAEYPAQEMQLLDHDGEFILRHTVFNPDKPVVNEITLSETLNIVEANAAFAVYAKENNLPPQFQAEDLTLYTGHTYASVL